MNKCELDRRTSLLLGVSIKEVRHITRAFLQEAAKAVAEAGHGGEVQLDGLGTLHVRRTNSRIIRHHVDFRKSTALQGLFQVKYEGKENTMSTEKYAVDESVDQETLEKQAAAGCPLCGRKPERHGTVLICPNCGSEPFETKRK